MAQTGASRQAKPSNGRLAPNGYVRIVSGMQTRYTAGRHRVASFRVVMAIETRSRPVAVPARDRALRSLARIATLAVLLASAGCHQPVANPPPSVAFDGLPVSGKLIDAKRASFNDCVNLDAVHIRCRRHGVMVGDAGPYEAAVDLAGSDGEGGFDQLTLWHDSDNNAVFKLTQALEASGWARCLTGNGRTGDQAIYMRKGAPVRISMDISYWSKRRVRLIPEWNQREGHCTPV